jgi:Tfp pilus assembly protein PilV
MKNKNTTFFQKYNFGQSLFEVILALAVSAIVLTGIVSLTSRSVSTSTSSKNKSQANRYAREAMEYIRTQKGLLGWSAFVTTAQPGDWCLSSLDFTKHYSCTTSSTDFISGTIFQRTLTVSNVSAKTMDITVKVVWIDEKGTHETRTVSAISDW